MKSMERVGGPLLGRRTWFRYKDKLSKVHHHRRIVSSWDTFEPIVTPPVHNEVLCVLPHSQFLTIISHKTGRILGHFCPELEDDDDVATMIHSVSLARVGRAKKKKSIEEQLQAEQEHNDSSDDDDESSVDSDTEVDTLFDYVVLVGCSNGTIQEFVLSSVFVVTRKQKNKAAAIATSHNLSGPCHGPRRVFKISDRPLLHLTVVPPLLDASSGTLAYALADQGLVSDRKIKKGKLLKTTTESLNDKKKQSSNNSTITAQMALLRIVVPPFDKKHEEEINLIKEYCVAQLDQFKCRLRGSHYNSFPFRLVSTARRPSSSSSSTTMDVFVTVGRSTSISIYHDQVHFEKTLDLPPKICEPVSFNAPKHNPITALATCTTDLACGYAEGNVLIWHDVYSSVLNYNKALKDNTSSAANTTKPPPHPAQSAIIKKLHWHAHAVTTLSYYNLNMQQSNSAGGDAMLMLYSGGIESVLITWQPSKGTYRPADILPRLAKGGIVHLENNGATVLVLTEDNALQLVQSHNQALIWKHEGLPYEAPQEQRQQEDLQGYLETTITPTPGNPNNLLVLRGMMGSPGCLHWYSPSQQFVVQSLEVVPYNRVSRTQDKDKAMPSPAILHSAFTKSGKLLVTVDAVWNELRQVGRRVLLPNNDILGVTHTLKFWTKSGGRYELSANMTHPHGRENLVSSMALSSDGDYVCTVSHDEGAFRVWHHVELDDDDDDEDDEQQGSRKIMSWVCQYKISTPSGFSNLPTRRNGVAFSSDGSLLAICFGNYITLWDHNDATLVSSTMRHLEDDDSPIDAIQFVKTDYLHDLLLTKSRNGVTLQTLFENIEDTRWSYRIPRYIDPKSAHVSHAALIPSHNVVAISLYFTNDTVSQVMLINAVNGDPITIQKKATRSKAKTKPEFLTWLIKGHVRAMGPASGEAAPPKSRWREVDEESSSKKNRRQQPKPEVPPIKLYVLMDDGQMHLLQGQVGDAKDKTVEDTLNVEAATTAAKRRTMLSSTDAPVLDLQTSRKRQKTTVSVNDDELVSANKPVLFGTVPDLDGGGTSTLPSSDLPVLSSAFTRVFLRGKLVKTSSAAADEESMEQQQ